MCVHWAREAELRSLYATDLTGSALMFTRTVGRSAGKDPTKCSICSHTEGGGAGQKRPLQLLLHSGTTGHGSRNQSPSECHSTAATIGIASHARRPHCECIGFHEPPRSRNWLPSTSERMCETTLGASLSGQKRSRDQHSTRQQLETVTWIPRPLRTHGPLTATTTGNEVRPHCRPLRQATCGPACDAREHSPRRSTSAARPKLLEPDGAPDPT